jgi:hypothetical protein
MVRKMPPLSSPTWKRRLLYGDLRILRMMMDLSLFL